MLGSFLLVRAFAVGDKFRKTEHIIASSLSLVYSRIMGIAFLLLILLLCWEYTVCEIPPINVDGKNRSFWRK